MQPVNLVPPEWIDGSRRAIARGRRRSAIFAVGIAVVTVLAFLPALRGEFLNWDDHFLFTENPNYRGLGIPQLKWMFTHALLAHYQPLTWMTLGLDYCIWGMNPLGYHLTSILWHAANAVLLFFLSRRILQLAQCRALDPEAADAQNTTRRLMQGAALASLVFAVHPLRVESVAWITERRDVVSLFFLLACTSAYLRYASNRENRALWYTAALGFYIASMLAKVWGLTWPLVLLVLDAYPLRRLTATEYSPRDRLAVFTSRLAEKVPFAAVAFVLGRYSYRLQSAYGIISSEPQRWTERLAKTFHALGFYLEKTIWPVGLGPIYEVPIPFDPFAPRFVFSAAAVAIIATGVAVLAARKPAISVSLLLYAIIISPTLGLVSSNLALTADRYSYVATIPLAVLMGASWLGRRNSRLRWRVQGTASMLAIVLLVGATWRQCGVWRSSESLWQRALQLDPHSWNAHNNLGALKMQERNWAAAAGHFRRALDRLPGNARCAMNLSKCLIQLQQPEEALKVLRAAADPASRDVAIQCTLVHRLLDLNDLVTAESLATALCDASPDDPFGHFAKAFVAERAGRRLAAGDSYVEAILRIEGRAGGPSRVRIMGPEALRYYRAGCKYLSVLMLERGNPLKASEYERKWVESGR